MRYFFFSLATLLASASFARASLSDLQYPISELGSCENQDACYAYCESPEHFDACMAFAEANQLLPQKQIERYAQMTEAIKNGGPGGCESQDACETYCSDLTHMAECIAFAEVNGLMGQEELAEAEKVLAALESGATLPGGCSSKDSCEDYCSDVTHGEECLAFAEVSGMMTAEELEQAEKMMTLMREGQTPGGCTSEETCRTYCEDGTHLEECMNFAVDSGVISEEEAEMESSFVGPGGCSGEEACREYCGDPAHQQECMEFFGGSSGQTDLEIDAPEQEYESIEPSTGSSESIAPSAVKDLFLFLAERAKDLLMH